MLKFVRASLITIFSLLILVILTQKIIAGQQIFSWSETKTKKSSVFQLQSLTLTPTPLPTVTSTVIPTVTTTPTIIPTKISYPTPTTPPPQPTIAPTAVPTDAPTPTPNISVSDPITYIMNAINDYRRSNGLYSVVPDPNTCNFAQKRAGEIVSNFNHDSFYNLASNNTLPYPSYSQSTENIAMVDDFKKVVDLWINSPTHAENMRKDTPYVCVASNGYYYAYEGWRP